MQSLDRDVQGIVPTIMVATGPRDRARTASFCQAVAQEVQARGIMVRIVALGIAQDPLGDATAMGAAHTAAQLWGYPLRWHVQGGHVCPRHGHERALGEQGAGGPAPGGSMVLISG